AHIANGERSDKGKTSPNACVLHSFCPGRANAAASNVPGVAENRAHQLGSAGSRDARGRMQRITRPNCRDRSRRSRSACARLAAALAAVCVVLGEALAHATDRGHVLLLPTNYYLAGGAVAVALTFAVLAVGSLTVLDRFADVRIRLFAVPDKLLLAGSFICLAFLAALVVIGFIGSRDPLSNPLPLMVWTVVWVGLTLLQGIAGDLWRWINPWYAPARLLSRLLGRGTGDRMPAWLGYWPAIVQFFAFAWFELVYPAPDDPARLALAVS